jgi:hypothetical protein
MLIRTLHLNALTAGALVLGSLGLASCSTGNSNATVTHTPALQTTGGRATARSSVQTTILATTTLTGLAVPGGLTPASAIRLMRDVMHGKRIRATGTSTGACNNGTKQSQVTNSDNSVTTTTDLYYDPLCVTLENELVMKVSPPATVPATGAGTLTTYDKSGTVTSVHTLALTSSTTTGSTTTETITLTDAASATAGGTLLDSFGATCTGTPNAVTMSCSFAHAGTTGGTTTGEAAALTATAGTNGSNANAAINASFYFGSIGIGQTSGTWGVSNASAFNSATGSYGYASTGTTGNGTLTLKDSLYSYSETATLSPTGLSVTLIQTPNSAFNTTTPIATATTDAGGNGAMTYSDGTVEPIWGGLIGA